MTTAAIYGCADLTLSRDEQAFFRDADPWGFILFRRNIETPDQVRALVAELRACVGRADAPVLIDQEGGRVQRLGPPHWPVYPSGAKYGAVARDPQHHQSLVRLGARLMAADLHDLGINVDCVPVLDVPQPGAHDVIGDRAYGLTPETVAAMGRAACEGLIAGGVLPVIKHIPGHGRAGADSHLELPRVDTPIETLEAVDFLPFRACSDMPLAMTAHVVYDAIDPKAPATTSKKAVRLIRESLGFNGLLMSDDLSMKALSGDFGKRVRKSLKAGCDVVLHCNGDAAEMTAIAAEVPRLKGQAARRAAAALARLPRTPEPFDREAAKAAFAAAFADAAG